MVKTIDLNNSLPTFFIARYSVEFNPVYNK